MPRIPKVFRHDLRISYSKIKSMTNATDIELASMPDYLSMPISGYFHEAVRDRKPATRRRMRMVEALTLFKFRETLEAFLGHKVYPPLLNEADSMIIEYASEFYCRSTVFSWSGSPVTEELPRMLGPVAVSEE